MRILINGREAKLKADTSFQFIAENRSFTGSDSYTLTIEFPLAGCPKNTAIFGHIHRADVEVGKVVFDCEIIDRTFYKAGVITITELSEVSVKTQFLEGRSVQNYEDTFDEIYINELELGNTPAILKENTRPEDCWYIDNPLEDFVGLPWVNDSSGNIQNEVSYDAETGLYSWVKAEGVTSLGYVSWQPYLIRVARAIFEAVGYKVDFQRWETSPWAFLLVCNTLPAAWGRRAIRLTLPHWTVTEFITQLERLMDAELDVDHKAKTVKFAFAEETMADVAPVCISKVVDEFTAEVSQESEAEYVGTTNLAFADAEHAMSPFYDCAWYVKKYGKDALVFDTLDELVAKAKTLTTAGVQKSTRGGSRTGYSRGYLRDSDGNKLFYAKDVDTYFIMKCCNAEYRVTDPGGGKWYEYTFYLCPVNQFGKLILNADEEDEYEEIGMVPVCVDDTSQTLGPCMFLAPAGYDSVSITVDDETGDTTYSNSRVYASSRSLRQSVYTDEFDDDYYNGGGLAYSYAGIAIYEGEEESSGEYYSQIFLGFWDGTNFCKGYLPRPILDRVTVGEDCSYYLSPYSMRINDRVSNSVVDIYNIADRRKYTFSFLTDEFPNPRAVFYIHGHRYVCEKLTATFSAESGMSRLVKGVFYQLED